MPELQIFKNDQFGEIRTTIKDGAPLFVAADVCRALEIQNHKDAIKRLDDDEKSGVVLTDPHGRPQETNCVTESGLYSLVLGSRKPEAKAFKRWITHEILPTIRKTGGYVHDEQIFVDTYLPNVDPAVKSLFSQTLFALRQANDKIAEDKPKVLFADAVSASSTSILIGELAKILNQNGARIGRNRLFAYLRRNGYLIKSRTDDYNLPTQKSMNLGLMEIKETVYVYANGETYIKRTPMITGKGQQYFLRKFAGGENAETETAI